MLHNIGNMTNYATRTTNGIIMNQDIINKIKKEVLIQ